MMTEPSIEENEISINANGGTELVKRGLGSRLDPALLKDFQIICSRVRELKQDKFRVYWLHDLPDDPELEHLKIKASRDRFHHFVFCGEWQYAYFQHHLSFPYSCNTSVIDNAIEPFILTEKPKDKIRLIYTSTPQRGLNILVPVFIELAKTYPNIHLDVFSSFKIYGWDARDKDFEPLYDLIRSHPQMTYHGFQPNNVVREYQSKAHIFAYPSTWVECNSISLIEAMSAGLLCIHPNYGGLVDTAGGMTCAYQGDSDPNIHAGLFYQYLKAGIDSLEMPESNNYLAYVKHYADLRFSWNNIIHKWERVLNYVKINNKIA